MQATINGSNLHYESQGEGPPIVFVHGLGGTSNVWHAQRAVLSRYFRVVAFDLTGSGRSDKSKASYSIDGWADDIAGLIDHLQLDQAVVVGHSMGTVIVQKFAAKYPQRTKAIVLAGALVELGAPGKEAFTKRAETVEQQGMIGVADAVLGGALSAGSREGNLALTGLVREMLLSNCPKCYAGHCRALVAGSAKADQAKITCPTLLVVGDQDPVTPLPLQRQIAAAIANSRIRIVPNTAHLTMLETPAAFNAIVLEFLATI
ncbi:MAG: alpha/beta fold hydrolase [Planctomycetia bacterium]|nr:alpha/beta fold hydrolase [Planctomycetia bacterium]